MVTLRNFRNWIFGQALLCNTGRALEMEAPRDWNFRSRLKFSVQDWKLKISSQDWDFRSGLNFFDRRALWEGGYCIKALFARFYTILHNFRLFLRVPNGVFQTMFFRLLTSVCDTGKPLQRNKSCLKTPVFSSILVPSALADPDRPLNAPLWKTPFRKHHLLLLGFLQDILVGEKRGNTQKSAKMRKIAQNTPFCAEACNNPAEFTPIVHPRDLLIRWGECQCQSVQHCLQGHGFRWKSNALQVSDLDGVPLVLKSLHNPRLFWEKNWEHSGQEEICKNLCFSEFSSFLRQDKRARRLTFLGPETTGWGGGLPREGVVVEKSVPSFLGLEGRNLGCPGNFAGMSQTPDNNKLSLNCLARKDSRGALFLLCSQYVLC